MTSSKATGSGNAKKKKKKKIIKYISYDIEWILDASTWSHKPEIA